MVPPQPTAQRRYRHELAKGGKRVQNNRCELAKRPPKESKGPKRSREPQSLVNNNFGQAIETDQNGLGVTCAAVKGFQGFWTLVIPPFHSLWTRS